MTTLARYTTQFARYLRNTRAVSALEYAILTGIIATVLAGAFATFTKSIETAIEDIATQVSGHTPQDNGDGDDGNGGG